MSYGAPNLDPYVCAAWSLTSVPVPWLLTQFRPEKLSHTEGLTYDL